MKKTIAILLMLALFTITLTGCSGRDKEGTGKTQYLSVGTGGVTGVYYPLGGALAKLITQNQKGFSCAAESTGGAVENATLLMDGKLDLGFVAASTLHDAQNGLGAFAGKETKQIQAIFSFFPEVVQIISLDKNIQSVPDLKGKKVAVGASGSGTEVMARAILELYGMSYDDISEDYLGFGDAVSGMKDGTVDVAFTWAGVPTASVMELCATHDISLISFSEEELQRLMQVSGYCVPATVTKDIYPKLYADANTFSIPAIICCNANLSEEFVYNFLTNVFANMDVLAQTHERGKDLTLETALDGLAAATLHPGAIKFFTEKGVIQ